MARRRSPAAVIPSAEPIGPAETGVRAPDTVPWLAGPRPARGVLVIGDPHLWSHQPGRRRDASFMATVLHKLEQAADRANRDDLWPLILGDLLHDDQDHDPAMLIRLTRVLQRFDRRPVTLVGNHDKDDVLRLTERNALLLLSVAGQIDLIDQPGFWARLVIERDGQQCRVAIGGTPFGHPLPHAVASYVGAADGQAKAALGVDEIIWLTHEDLAFENAYPGALPLHAIDEVDTVFNGHMHGTKKPQKLGATEWFNPGNITRLTVDMADHVPAVWEWNPMTTEDMPSAEGLRVRRLIRHPLQFTPGADIFNFEGRHGTSQGLEAEPNLPLPARPSLFALNLQQDQGDQQTDDGTYMAEAIERLHAERETPEPVQRILWQLFTQAVENKQESRA